jgi:hypothetical protein
MPSEQFFSFVLDKYALFYSASLLKQEFMGRHVAPLRHITLISSQPVFTPTP